MRVFLGIKTSIEFEKEILKWQKENSALPVRFIAPKNMHITLVPPWYEKNIKKLIKTLSKLDANLNTKEITFTQIFHSKKINPRVIWAEAEDTRDIKKLSKELTQLLKKPKNTRPYILHATIGRIKAEDIRQVPDINIKIKIKLKIESLELFESKLTRLGAEYTIIKRFPLKRAEPDPSLTQISPN